MRIFPALLFVGVVSFSLLFPMNISCFYHSSYPDFTHLPAAEVRFSDFGGILLGSRRISADIAWIELLQYYGSAELLTDEESPGELYQDFYSRLFNPAKHQPYQHEHHHHHYEGGVYPRLLPLCQRIIRLDPYFQYVYLYGSAALAWNLNRPEEAVALLEEGIKYNPQSLLLRVYLGAIIYKKMDNFAGMTSLLDEVVADPECPVLLKNILANIYKKAGKFESAANIYRQIMETSLDSRYRQMAKEKLQQISGRMPAN